MHRTLTGSLLSAAAPSVVAQETQPGHRDQKKRRRKPPEVLFEAARPEDDEAVRALLRNQPMGGRVELSLEREPHAQLAAGIEGDRPHTLVGRELDTGRVVVLMSRAVRSVWVNGEVKRVGYLGQLRRHPSLRSRVGLLARGFAACDHTRLPDELPYDLTSIVSDNTTARRLFERASHKFPGVPAYRPFCELVTVMIPVGRRRKRLGPAALGQRHNPPSLEAIARCLERNGRRHQFAPVWTADDLKSDVRCRGLRRQDFMVRRDRQGRVTACLARWDQGAFKQAVVRRYHGNLGRYRWLINPLCLLAGYPRLPAVGQPINFAYLSHVAVDNDDSRPLLDLVDEARRRSAGLDYLVLGFAATHPLLEAVLGHFPARTYRSMIYLVHPVTAGPRRGGRAEISALAEETAAEAIRALDGRTPHLEVATL